MRCDNGFEGFYGGGHSFRRSLPIRPGVGRNIGAKGCEGECLKAWIPAKAPTGAQPSGFWDVATRDDGTRQRVYQGFPLYAFTGDATPGDMNGNDTYDILLSDDSKKVDEVGTPLDGTAALYWTVAYP